MSEARATSTVPAATRAEGKVEPTRQRWAVRRLALGALGVVYGDIGTSPLYALKECVTLPHGVAPVAENILGLLSLIFWAIVLVVSVKYITFVMRADNNGEGGVLSLMVLAGRDNQAKDGPPGTTDLRKRNRGGARRSGFLMIMLGLFGASLLAGDGVITPAISVLSAVEGLGVATHAFEPIVVPLTCAILLGVFWVQKRGTGRIGAIFGPVTLIWFVAIATCGVP